MMEGIMACAKKQAEVNKCGRRESEATQARRAAEAELENLQEQLGVSKKQKEDDEPQYNYREWARVLRVLWARVL
jgi:predicted  nucleic acid-binding Zn-ribbon protein